MTATAHRVRFYCEACHSTFNSATGGVDGVTRCPICERGLTTLGAVIAHSGRRSKRKIEEIISADEQRLHERTLNTFERSRDEFTDDHAGHPLGNGMPTGSPLRQTVWRPQTNTWRGESHQMAWERIIRGDPCVYCGEMIHYSERLGTYRLGAGTVDHIEPRRGTVDERTGEILAPRTMGSPHGWLNLSASCTNCNGSKARRPLLRFLLQRVS